MGCLSFLFPPRLGSAELVVTQSNSAQTGRRIAIKFILRSYKLYKQNSTPSSQYRVCQVRRSSS